MSILVVGRGFLGRAIADALGPEQARLVAHDALAGPDLDSVTGLLNGIRTIVYAGRHPALGRADWRIDDELEIRLAHRIKDCPIAFLSLGTRKVYAPSPGPLTELSPLGPTDLYGRQKLAIEHALVDRLGPKLLRLRLANIVGFERDPARTSFLTSALRSLAQDGEIRFDMSPFVPRDFLPLDLAAAWIAQLAQVAPDSAVLSGIAPDRVVNVSSGIALPTGRLALWIIAGFGSGRLVVTSPSETDPFVLDTTRLRALLPGAICTYGDLQRYCFALGRRLRAEITAAGPR